MRKIMTASVPFIVLLAAWAAVSQAVFFDIALISVILVLPYVIAVLALFMSIWYKNSSTFFLTAFILFSYILISIASPKEAMLIEAVTMISILLPINTIWLTFIKERGIISTYGANKSIIVAIEIVWVLINMLGKADSSLPEGFLRPDSVVILKAPAIMLYVVAICILLANYLLKSHYISLVFVSVLIATYISFHFAHRPIIIAIFTGSVFVIMVIALFEVSYSLAFYDTLTGILSRRAMEQELLKLGSNYSIAMVDIDHFKRINDNYGHDVGDEVLKMVASIIEKVSGRAKVFRYGGEEFAVLFNGNGCADALITLENMRKAVERRPFIIRSDSRPQKKPQKIDVNSNGQGRINVTVSIGVAQKTDSVKSAYDVIKKADEALYKSKSDGRNRVSR